MEHYHYIVTGFVHQQPDGTLTDFATIDVFATGEEDALARAAKLVEKPFYRVASVITHNDEICPRGVK
tara:strand:+ start:763 stop:966 length:204 start_codon:yes stop_codon:yes gene_type:complete